MMRLLSVCFLIQSAAASTLKPPTFGRQELQRLRGGEEDAPSAVDPSGNPVELPPRVGLTKEEIMQKLNGVPTFSIVNAEGNMVAMTDAVGDKKSCCWFVDATEAKAIVEVMQKANPSAGLKLACHGLGGAFTQCNGWPDEKNDGISAHDSATGADVPVDAIEFRLQGNHALVNSTEGRLKEMLADLKIDPGCWTLPVFLSEKLASMTPEGPILPVFLHPKDLATVWESAKKPKEELANEIMTLDLRMLVQQMQTDDTSPWSMFHLLASPAAIELAAELAGGKKAGGAAEGATTSLEPAGDVQAAAAADPTVLQEEEEEVMI